MARPGGVVLLGVSEIDGVQQAFAPGLPGAHGNFTPGDLDRAARLLLERPVPTVRFVIPRAYEQPILHHNHPHANEAMVRRAGTEADDLAVTEGGEHGSGEVARASHLNSNSHTRFCIPSEISY